MSEPTFTIEPDKIGLGFCVIALWSDGRREVVTGFGTETDAAGWIAQDSAGWLSGIPTQVRGTHWVNNRLPAAHKDALSAMLSSVQRMAMQISDLPAEERTAALGIVRRTWEETLAENGYDANSESMRKFVDLMIAGLDLHLRRLAPSTNTRN